MRRRLHWQKFFVCFYQSKKKSRYNNNLIMNVVEIFKYCEMTYRAKWFKHEQTKKIYKFWRRRWVHWWTYNIHFIWNRKSYIVNETFIWKTFRLCLHITYQKTQTLSYFHHFHPKNLIQMNVLIINSSKNQFWKIWLMIIS